MKKMSCGIHFQIELFQFLNDHAKYAVLRNFAGLPEKNESRDIDFVIEEADYYALHDSLVRKIEELGFNIVIFYRSERLITFVCGSKEDLSLVQLDFFLSCSVKGLLLIPAKAMLETREYENGIWHVSKEFEFLDKYSYLKATGHEYPDKYQNVYEEVSKSNKIDEVVKDVFGIDSLESLVQMSYHDFKTIIVKRNVKNNILKSLCFYLNFIKWHISNRLSCHGFAIGFTGPDGSGKTTVITDLIKVLNQIQRNVPLYHFRPTILGNMGDVAHGVGLKKDVDHQWDKPHRGGKTGKFSSFIRLCYYTTDYIIGYWAQIRMFLSNRMIVIFDRYYTDIIADSRRSKINLSHKFLYFFGKLFVPSLKYNILLTASSKSILARKRELDKESIDEINRKLDFLKSKKDYYLVLNESTPQDTIKNILTQIFEKQHQINKRRLK